MSRALVDVQFPRGKIPVKGWRCPECGESVFSAQQADAAQRMARELGLFGPERASRRKLQRSGTSIVVTLDPALLEEALGGASVGDEVEVGRLGDAIIIRRPSSK